MNGIDEARDDLPAAEVPEDAATSPESTAVSPPTASWPRTAMAVLLAWLVPGSGHVFLGQLGRGLLFGVVILAMFAAGIGLEGKLYAPALDDPLTALAALAGAGVGAPYLLVRWNGGDSGRIDGALHEYGTAFALTAGLLNLLVVLDVLDVARGRRP